MAELVELQNRIVQIRELEVGGNDIGVGVVCRVLHGAEIVDAVFGGHYDDTARMLTCGTFDTNKAADHLVYLCARQRDTFAFKIFHNEAESGLGSQGTDSTCAEHVAFAEELFSVFMHLTLHVT